ncbi:hypothetical protein [Chlamydia felis Fe/C-56]|uniref:Macro domain-containing protein n=1 Tax=Chlamydia felis (strain Fe/C-56) TaxID=264202 RepID=Q253T9_CHLFF|nr:hypothetical protein [Chlamydia felis]BAE81449.1 hypothetical protein [Chlamydia felis Fe/C-56]
MSIAPTNDQNMHLVTETPATHVKLGGVEIRITRILYTISTLGIILSIGGIAALCLGSSLTLSLPLILVGMALLILSCLLLATHMKKTVVLQLEPIPITPQPPTPTVFPLHPETPPESPVVTSPELPETRECLEIQIPGFLDFTPQYIAKLLRTRLSITRVHPSGRINKHTQYITARSKTSDVQLCFLKGHPLHDPFLKPTNSAMLVLTNSEREHYLLLGRSAALAPLIEKKCWNEITQPESLKFPPGSIISGLWKNQSPATPPASHIICMNPPTIKLKRDVYRRAINFYDFDYQQEFETAVNMYQDCFRICRENGLTSLQIEILGLNHIGPDQEEYEAWYSGCALALLEAIRLEEENENRTLTHITVNHRSQLPLLASLQQAYES